MNIWVVIIAAGILTYLTRFSLIWLYRYITLPDWVQRALRFVPISVLAIIIFQELVIRGNQLSLSFGNTRLIAGLIAAVIAWRTRNTLLTIGLGMVILWALNYLTTLM